MQRTELQRGLQDLADELAPFEADLADLHRRDRRRKTTRRVTAIAAVLVVAVGVGGFVALRSDNRKRVIVSNPVKERTLSELHRVEYVVTPANAEVQNALEGSAVVAHYTRVGGIRSVSRSQPVRDVFCALQQGDAFAVETAKPGVDVKNAIAGAVPAGARVIPIPNADARFDVVLDENATPAQINGVRAALAGDAQVASFDFVPHDDAVSALVGNDPTPRHPPAFFVYPADGVALDPLASRYGDLPGVLHSGDSRAGVPPTVFEIDNRWHDEQLEIFMKPDAPPSRTDAVRNALAADTEVASVRFVSHQDAFEEFKRVFANQPDLLKSTTADAVPESFRVTLHDSGQTQAVADRYRNVSGVDTVVTAQAGCRTP